MRRPSASKTRSDEIRANRNAAKPRTRFNPQQIMQASRKSPVVAVRPVTTRGAIPGVTTRVTARKRVQGSHKKAYYFSLKSLGAEVRLPAIPTIQFGWRLLSGLIVLAMLFAIYVMWNQPMFQLEQLTLKGAKRLKTSDVAEVLNIKGSRVIEIRPDQVTKDLQTNFPEFFKIKVQVSLPAGLTISVSERLPVIAWQEEEKAQWIDKNGVAFQARGAEGAALVQVSAQGKPPALPSIAEGSQDKTPSTAPAVTQPFINPDLVKAILTLAPQVPADTPILFSPQYGLGWNDPEGWQVFFGSNTDDISMKLAQYRAIVDQLKKQGAQPTLISVEFPHAPYYRLEQ